MLEKCMKYIETEKERYPLICTMNTLEYVQNNYHSIQRFQNLVSGITVDENEEKSYTPINVSAMMDGFTTMVNEGIDVYNWKRESTDGQSMLHITRQQASMILREAGISLSDAATLVLTEMTECIVGKNVLTVQGKEGAEKKCRSTLHGFCMLRGLFSVLRKKKQDTCSSGNI